MTTEYRMGRIGDEDTFLKLDKATKICQAKFSEYISDVKLEDGEEAIDRAQEIGYPVMLKASAGGGGKGLRVASNIEECREGFERARNEAMASFSDPRILIEKYIVRPRHIEIQVIGDKHGNSVYLGERECSIQRRHQKVLEETPSLELTDRVRERMGKLVAKAARAVGYVNAGTFEFLLDPRGRFYFMEANARIQVEHPITEMVTGIDLVQWQIRIARGEPLTVDPARALTAVGHAIECRVYAEDPDAGFLPAPGRITALRGPSGPGVRDDSGVEAGFDVPVFYDSMISKVSTWAPDRAGAIARMRSALHEYQIGGITTVIPALLWVLAQDRFRDGAFDTSFLDGELAARAGESFSDLTAEQTDLAVIAAALSAYLSVPQATAAVAVGATSWRQAARLEGVGQ